ncbi:MAG: histone deacetylase family protein [Candidatus Heimdallarchaeota archaeon]|nr:MAG: histone deacetylase family protein [Candidatus Heimdallarchaeota archaeon]
MKKHVIFHQDYYKVYTSDPAADSGRMEAIVEDLHDYNLKSPKPAIDNDILLVHTENHLLRVKNSRVYAIALLAAGGAILASDYACNHNEPMFALIRPPGHHASPEGFWGFCYFNNIAIAIKRLISENQISKAVIIDFDLHFGDGTHNTFRNSQNVEYYHVEGRSRDQFVQNVRRFLSDLSEVDIIGVSAGFDRHEKDWGGLLTTEDYKSIGKIIREYSEDQGSCRRFGVLEGGYNHYVLGKNVRAFLDGFY